MPADTAARHAGAEPDDSPILTQGSLLDHVTRFYLKLMIAVAIFLSVVTISASFYHF
jgi:hypothetical protein